MRYLYAGAAGAALLALLGALRLKRHMVSNDPDLETKAADVIRL
jgi:hypothetical protein